MRIAQAAPVLKSRAAAGTGRGSHYWWTELTLPTSNRAWRCVAGVDESRASNQALAKQIVGLESHLDQSQSRCSATLVQNKRLRERITKMRKERMENDAMYAEAERQLVEKKAELARITAESLEAYETRDAAHAELRKLRAQEEREQGEFEKEWREMARMIERDKLLKDFMRKERAKLKGKERSEPEGVAKRVRCLAHARCAAQRAGRHVASELRRCSPLAIARTDSAL